MKSPLVVIPLFNELETIVGVLQELALHYAGKVLIVDDGSSDGSVAAVRRAAEHGDLRELPEIVSHPQNRGYGASLISGFSYAARHGHDTIVSMDCDRQHQPCMVPRFIEKSSEADVISGSRYLPESKVCGAAPKDRPRINQHITKRVNEITSYGITDAFCGFKAFRTDAVSKLKLDEVGYAFPVQFWIQAWCTGLSVIEIPVDRIYFNVGRSFGGNLDNPEARLAYYETVLARELNECSRST